MCLQLMLNHGSLYTAETNHRVDAAQPVHRRGYFELMNKEDSMICVKLTIGGDALYEAAKPSFIAVPPLESCYCEFGPTVTSLEVFSSLMSAFSVVEFL